MGSKIYASVAELEGVILQLTESERQQCSSQTAPEVTLFFPDTLQAKIDSIDPAVGQRNYLLAYAGNVRWLTETGGIIVDGHPIKTDADSQRKTATLNSDMRAGTTTAVDYKLADGTFIENITPAQVDSFYLGVQAHVKKCYEVECGVSTDIHSGAITTTAAIDAAFATIPTLPASMIQATTLYYKA